MARVTQSRTDLASPGSVQGGAGLPLNAHLDAVTPRGPDALSGKRTFNDCGSSVGRAMLGREFEPSPQSPSLAVASLPPSTRPPGAGLPEFRALLFIAAFPVAVVAFVAAILFIFLP